MSIDMKAGDLVVYIPSHAQGDIFHPDCEVGIVKTLQRGKNAFINYYTHGQLQQTAQRTYLDDLKPYPFKKGDMCWLRHNEVIVVDFTGETVRLKTKDDELLTTNYRKLRLTRQTKIKNIFDGEAE